ncbi:MAG: twin-arginine translocase TatA/TatE family subunit, partial [Chloroflexi bacterium]|nr:twin-arginine translocase TatA/TatE family subunit [Chloroflexota bacterium]
SLEIIIVLLVAFLVLGPNQLLVVAKGLGKVMRELRNATVQFTRMLEEEGQEEPSKTGKEEEEKEKKEG